jgi:general stress protein 26
LINDREKIEELWRPILKAWFPKGLGDPSLALLKISIEEAEYWDSSSSALVQIAGFVKAIATGERMEGGDHVKVSF